MTEHVKSSGRHVLGLLVAIIATAAIFLIWEYGLSYLDGTPFEELRYVIFAVVAIGLLSVLNNLISKLMG